MLGDQRVQLFAQFAGHRFGVSGANFARIQQALGLPTSDVEGGNLAWPCAQLLDKSHNRKGIALLALELDPEILTA
jgi:hypothetical protein